MNSNSLHVKIAAALCCLVPLVAAGQEPARRSAAVGHRGLMQAAPENTLAAFRACLSLCVGFEFDIRRTKDGQLVVLHDASVARTTNGRQSLSELTFEEVQKLDAGSWFDPAFRGERIPRVEEVFALLAEHASPGTVVAVDLKETGSGLEDAVVRLAAQHKVLDHLVFIGETIQSADVRARLRQTNTATHVARLADAAEKISEVLSDSNADWVYVRFLPSTADMSRVHQTGKRVFIAGPLVAGQETENWQKAANLGLDAILTDYPLELQGQLRKNAR